MRPLYFGGKTIHPTPPKATEGKIRPFLAYSVKSSAAGMAVEALGKALGGGVFFRGREGR